MAPACACGVRTRCTGGEERGTVPILTLRKQFGGPGWGGWGAAFPGTAWLQPILAGVKVPTGAGG